MFIRPEVFVDATPPPAAEPEPVPLPLPPATDLPPEPLPLPAPVEPALQPQPAADHPVPPFGFTVRRFVHIVTLLFCLFLVVRTTFVEPFGVTTGSMAETIRGNRHERACWRCGCPVCVGTADDARGSNPQFNVFCPNCGAGHDPTAATRPNDPNGLDLRDDQDLLGDRLMVDKLVFRLRPPRRWEVAVFRCPEPEGKAAKERDELTVFEAKLPIDDERKAYVKRTVGLPGERVRVFDGDVYANGELQRKTLPQVRETRIPVFRMDFAPPGGWAARWETGPVVGSPKLPKDPPPPAVEGVVRGGDLVLDATTAPVGLTYRHRDLDTNKDEVIRDRVGYNGSLRREWVPVHDFMIGCEVEVVGGAGGAFAVRLGDGADTVKVHMPVHPDTSSGTAVIAHEGGKEQAFAEPFALVPGRRYRLEFAFIDRRVLVAIDGKEMAPPLDLPPVTAGKGAGDPAGKRAGLDRPVQLGCRGGHVVVRHFTLWRDIHYRSDPDAKHGVKDECRLGPDEYFMLGDNSANSRDSREWETPGVPERDFLGKPFLVHQPLKPPASTSWPGQRDIDWERLRLLE